MDSMFKDIKKLKSIIFYPYINTYNINNMRNMFYGCSSLTSINISNFNTQNVKNMECMFSECSSLTKLDLSNFNTSSVQNMIDMFSKCNNLQKNIFDTSNKTLIPLKKDN
jgi:surface protein